MKYDRQKHTGQCKTVWKKKLISGGASKFSTNKGTFLFLPAVKGHMRTGFQTPECSRRAYREFTPTSLLPYARRVGTAMWKMFSITKMKTTC